ncbi:MAG: hypothetical protein AAGU76_08645 [Sedimentibacter sp.]|uniref:hypothetical protein n=1 Tax=Sedimentibacter sp. TaxID=1960295 RepID=UPI003159886D
MKERITRLFKGQIELFFSDIIEKIDEKFKETVDEKIITSANLLTDNINLWYLKNNLKVPALQVSSCESSIVVSNKIVWFGVIYNPLSRKYISAKKPPASRDIIIVASRHVECVVKLEKR